MPKGFLALAAPLTILRPTTARRPDSNFAPIASTQHAAPATEQMDQQSNDSAMAKATADRLSRLAEEVTPSDRLTSLPVELLVTILESFSIREVCRLRIVNSRLKEVIDDNEDALALVSINFHRHRIQSRIKWLLDTEGLDLLEILQRHASYYGDLSTPGTGIGQLDVRNGTIVYLPIHHVPLDDDIERPKAGRCTRFWLDLPRFWSCFIRCHRWMHSHSPNQSSSYEEIQHDWARLEAIAATFDDPVNDVEYLRARVQDSTFFSGPHYTNKHGVPRHPLTTCQGLKFNRRGKPFDDYGAFLMERFQLPPPSENSSYWPHDMRLSYYVKTWRMRNMVTAACTPRKPGSLAAKPWKAPLLQSRLLQAALMEEIFVF